MQHIAEPFAELHPDDARMLGVMAATLVEVSNGDRHVALRALLNPRQQRGTVFVPMHWNAAFSGNALVNRLVAAHADPVSGQPELKWSAVSVRPVKAAWYGFAVSRERPDCAHLDYWSLAPAERGYRLECAGMRAVESFDKVLENTFACQGDRIAYHDCASGEHRFAIFDGDRLEVAMFFGRRPVGASRNWLAAQLGDGAQGANRLRLLAGRGGQDGADHGAIVCSCFSIGIKRIAALIASGEASNVEDVGALLKAGTNCGSCKPEIARIVHETLEPSALAPGATPHRTALGAAGFLRS
jgi:assimilatory nitrate reductase catalytic subunit